MISDDTIRMAREAGFTSQERKTFGVEILLLAAMVSTAERKACAEHYLGIMRAAVAAEIEACAKAADEHMQECEGKSFGVGAAIRARSQS